MSECEDFAHRAVNEWAITLPDLPATPDELSAAIRLSRIAGLQDRIDLRTLSQYHAQGVRGPGDFRTLALLRRAHPEGVSNRELIDQLGGSKAGMSSRLEHFRAAGITARVASKTDGRSQLNHLTDMGYAMADQTVRAVVGGRRTMLASLSPTQVAQLSDLLGTIISSVDPTE